MRTAVATSEPDPDPRKNLFLRLRELMERARSLTER